MEQNDQELQSHCEWSSMQLTLIRLRFSAWESVDLTPDLTSSSAYAWNKKYNLLNNLWSKESLVMKFGHFIYGTFFVLMRRYA